MGGLPANSIEGQPCQLALAQSISGGGHHCNGGFREVGVCRGFRDPLIIALAQCDGAAVLPEGDEGMIEQYPIGRGQ